MEQYIKSTNLTTTGNNTVTESLAKTKNHYLVNNALKIAKKVYFTYTLIGSINIINRLRILHMK